MSWLRHRQPLLLTALLDGLAIYLGYRYLSSASLYTEGISIHKTFVLIITYWIFSWLFGSYSLLRWSKLSLPLMLQRVGMSALATLALAFLSGQLFNTTPLKLSIVQSGYLMHLMLLTVIASMGVRITLNLFQRHQTTKWSILADATEVREIITEWERCPNSFMPNIIKFNYQQNLPGLQCEILAISPNTQKHINIQLILEKALVKGIRITSLADLAEKELQRIPAKWFEDSVLQIGELSDRRQLIFNRQLKRLADLSIASSLLVLLIPLFIGIALAIYLQDRGPILYTQIRTGLFGDALKIYKFRTMIVNAEAEGATWSIAKDQRITPMGKWLRQTRLDELPQLINIIKGEMSLIGPRPERPELEHNLEAKIPNYRLRHLLRPGLSGWAQVNMAYASSVEDAELKLSYDLYYLRNYGPWLDVLILIKTVKTVLKGAGR
ncbi:sugar transferase [Synechococcus lacustris]|uniref:sugar transferase n=1 Tax=Synechococcus lacustris TaxID=2116544 RepID=UPI0020CE39F2|nr:sugar transferase [Synechococcus lacustris]MCP9794243.1 sugar transferase [Synechococcus lacustris L1F-Slac]